MDEKNIRLFMDYGLQGVDVFYTKYAVLIIEYYMQIARKYGLAVTGGSYCCRGNIAEVLIGRIRFCCRYVDLLRTLTVGKTL